MEGAATAATGGTAVDVGVVLVHGIGNQQPGQLLQTMAKPCIDAMRIYADSADLRLVEARAHPKPGDSSPQAILVQLQDDTGGVQRSVRFSEAVWSSSFVRPSAARIVWWLLQNLPATVLLLSPDLRDAESSNFDGPSPGTAPQGMRRVIRFLVPYKDYNDEAVRSMMSILRLVVRVLVATLIVTACVAILTQYWILAILVVIGIIAYLRSHKSVAGHVVLAATESTEVQKMVDAVEDGLAWAASRSRKLVIVAHSQGGYLCHRALTGTSRGTSKELKRRVAKATFIGVGSGLKPIWILNQLHNRCWVLRCWILVAAYALWLGVWWQFAEETAASMMDEILMAVGMAASVLIVPLGMYTPALYEDMAAWQWRTSTNLPASLWVDISAAISLEDVALLMLAAIVGTAVVRKFHGDPGAFEVAPLVSARWLEYSSPQDLVGRMLLPELPQARQLVSSAGGHPVLDHVRYFAKHSLLPYHLVGHIHRAAQEPTTFGRTVQQVDRTLLLNAGRRRLVRGLLLSGWFAIAVSYRLIEGDRLGSIVVDTSFTAVVVLAISSYLFVTWEQRQSQQTVDTMVKSLRTRSPLALPNTPTPWRARVLPSLLAVIGGFLFFSCGVGLLGVYPASLPPGGTSMFVLSLVEVIYATLLVAGYRPYCWLLMSVIVSGAAHHILLVQPAPSPPWLPAWAAQPGMVAVVLALTILLPVQLLSMRARRMRATQTF